jgi:hypothetical protein
MTPSNSRRLLGGVLALAAIGCAERPLVTSAAPAALQPPLVRDGVRASLALVDSAATLATVVVTVDARGMEVGAYSGRVAYDSTALELVSSTVPQDGSRFSNAAEPGVVRFAGFTTGAFRSDTAAELTFRVRDWRGLRALRATLAKAGTTSGAAVGQASLQSAPVVLSAVRSTRARSVR